MLLLILVIVSLLLLLSFVLLLLVPLSIIISIITRRRRGVCAAPPARVGWHFTRPNRGKSHSLKSGVRRRRQPWNSRFLLRGLAMWVCWSCHTNLMWVITRAFRAGLPSVVLPFPVIIVLECHNTRAGGRPEFAETLGCCDHTKFGTTQPTYLYVRPIPEPRT